MLRRRIGIVIILCNLALTQLIAGKPNFDKGKFKNIISSSETVALNIIFNKFSEFTLYDRKNMEIKINDCIQHSLANNSDDCDFAVSYYSKEAYDEYFRKVNEVRRMSSDPKFNTSGRMVNQFPEPLSKYELCSKITDSFCEFYRWCKRNPRPAKYILSTSGFYDSWFMVVWKEKYQR